MTRTTEVADREQPNRIIRRSPTAISKSSPSRPWKEARQKADTVAEAVDKSEQAQEVSAGILKPIYQLAEMFAFPAFHWIAFAVMVAGVVSFALQLTIGKLLVLAKSSFSPAEVLSLLSQRKNPSPRRANRCYLRDSAELSVEYSVYPNAAFTKAAQLKVWVTA